MVRLSMAAAVKTTVTGSVLRTTIVTMKIIQTNLNKYILIEKIVRTPPIAQLVERATVKHP